MPIVHFAAFDILIVDLPPAIRMGAARLLVSRFLQGSNLTDLSSILRRVVDDESIPAAERAAAAVCLGSVKSPEAALKEVLLLAQELDEELWLMCGKELRKLNRTAHSRRLLMRTVREGTNNDHRSNALWELGFQNQFDELLAAFHEGEIAPELYETLEMVFLELGRGATPFKC
ncbi:MAG: hypothetical protein AAF394_09325 [Planctomycetota bacterium]